MDCHVEAVVVNTSFLNSLFNLLDYLKTVQITPSCLNNSQTQRTNTQQIQYSILIQLILSSWVTNQIIVLDRNTLDKLNLLYDGIRGCFITSACVFHAHSHYTAANSVHVDKAYCMVVNFINRVDH